MNEVQELFLRTLSVWDKAHKSYECVYVCIHTNALALGYKYYEWAKKSYPKQENL